MIKVLYGVRVLEMGTFITGPAAAMLLADMGADVVKVERPKTGDPFRAFNGGLYSPHYQTYNRNKRSLTIDTGVPADLKLLDELVSSADVFIQNFRPGVAENLSVGAARLQKINPSLIYCGISGFGPDGPDADRPAYDTVAQAASGWLRLLINPENPRVVGPAIADSVTGFYAALFWAPFTNASTQGEAGASRYRCWKPCVTSISTISRTIFRRTRLWAPTAGPVFRSLMSFVAPTTSGSRCTCRRRKNSGKGSRVRSDVPICFRTRALPAAQRA
jgi:hypothetical protein